MRWISLSSYCQLMKRGKGVHLSWEYLTDDQVIDKLLKPTWFIYQKHGNIESDENKSIMQISPPLRTNLHILMHGRSVAQRPDWLYIVKRLCVRSLSTCCLRMAIQSKRNNVTGKNI